MNAILALEDGTTYQGVAAGAAGETTGEVVFNTSMTGYQEVLTDPSYAGQIVTMTAPQIGNYGVAAADHESAMPQVAGFIMRDESPVASNWRAQGTLKDYLTAHGIVAIADIDTRALTRKLRSGGVMRGIIATGPVDPQLLVEKARSAPQMAGADLVKDVTCSAALRFQHVAGRERHPGQLRLAAENGAPDARCGWPPTTTASRPISCAGWPRTTATCGSSRRRRRRPSCWHGSPTGSSSATAPATRRRWATPSRTSRRWSTPRSRCSASASATSCWRWASAPRPTSSSSATAAPTTR